MIKKYENKDYSTCKKIINDIWYFDNRFKPQNLSKLFKKIYILDSLSISNFAIVIEEDGDVKGFLFGNCGNKNLYKNEYSGLLGRLRVITDLLLTSGVSLKKKLHYMNIIKEHEKNRDKIEPSRANEVNLFAVNPKSQGKGYGKILLNEFINYCKTKKVNRITLETDKECNYKFYTHLGFEVKGKFYSPLQKEYTGTSDESFVFELMLNKE